MVHSLTHQGRDPVTAKVPDTGSTPDANTPPFVERVLFPDVTTLATAQSRLFVPSHMRLVSAAVPRSPLPSLPRSTSTASSGEGGLPTPAVGRSKHVFAASLSRCRSRFDAVRAEPELNESAVRRIGGDDVWRSDVCLVHVVTPSQSSQTSLTISTWVPRTNPSTTHVVC